MHAVAFLFIAQYSLELLNNSKNWGGYLGKCIFANIISYLGCFSIGAFPECEAFPEIPHTHTLLLIVGQEVQKCLLGFSSILIASFGIVFSLGHFLGLLHTLDSWAGISSVC